ncbi:putative Peroxidase superfamily protein [Tripterygium wilfordii]|uniref:peroxidase n=2 Tax=Tripterygium wilfordii TaxID=458696 RepID=A0A7J7BYE5_TRIWF|nr:putative Peroxidase superfamily protein [Tripterygium wilfordii]
MIRNEVTKKLHLSTWPYDDATVSISGNKIGAPKKQKSSSTVNVYAKGSSNISISVSNDDMLMFLSIEDDENQNEQSRGSLEYDFYRDSCPQGEKIIRDTVRQLYKTGPELAPALLRLVFHDCFIEGCDGSVLLDPAEGVDAEKESPPNETLKGFDIIDLIKSEVEEVCPGVVSCSDVLVLAAREAVILAGGPFYPLYTGRRDSNTSYRDIATYELPSPHADLSETLASFASRGFNERETVTLLGAHSVGVVHCQFFENRLYNFGGTNEPDPSLNPKLLDEMRSRCKRSHTPTSSAPLCCFDGSPSSSALAPTFDGSPSPTSSATKAVLPTFEDSSSSLSEVPGMDMAYEGPGSDFGTPYYHSLLQGKGILFADQQLTAGEETGIWVRAYASDTLLFRRDFALAMMKLSNLQVLTAPMGQVRRSCSKVA